MTTHICTLDCGRDCPDMLRQNQERADLYHHEMTKDHTHVWVWKFADVFQCDCTKFQTMGD